MSTDQFDFETLLNNVKAATSITQEAEAFRAIAAELWELIPREREAEAAERLKPFWEKSWKWIEEL